MRHRCTTPANNWRQLNNLRSVYSQLLLGFFSVLLSACSQTEVSIENNKFFPASPIILSADLSSIYQRSCQNCHEAKATGAPLTGDKQAWGKILSKGPDAVLDKAMIGSGGMPPAGQCYECSPEQIASLINYMAHPGKPTP